MLFSPTVSAAAGAVVAVVGVLTLRRQRKALAWVKRMRGSDDDAQDCEDAAAHLRNLFEMLCDRAHRPCRARDFEPLHGLRHLLADAAQGAEGVRPELDGVVARLDRCLDTVLRRCRPPGRPAAPRGGASAGRAGRPDQP
ncbi:hypothetical protein [Streptomyces fuscichromogenes]|uniref:Uncharacterized protein n=1 Tax=Streptomyces fuscichromogenes TaxID=1324013 RepID=A0A918CUD3_9ACTN|nr:hypothetical protein [Streptomyces fuscichromogenes]GGN27401.1 hypothetical protein GCM10011578_062680 [Streptomyces fuscichromogenes]